MTVPAEAAESNEVIEQEQEGKQPEQVEAAQDSHLISLAKKLGHKSKDEFDGPEGKWVDADEFVAKRFEILSERFERTSNKVKAVEQMLESVTSHIGKVEKVAYERAISDLKQKRREAIENGDADRVDELDGEIEKVANDIKAEVPKKETEAGVSQEIQKWVSENKWFNSDKAMTAFASAVSQQYIAENPDTGDAGMLEYVDKEIRKRFPEKFENAKRKTPPPVETGGSGGASSGKGYSRNDLNDDQKKVHDYYVKRRVMSSADYIKSLIEIGELGGKK